MTGRGNDFHPDDFSANSLKNPTGEARFSAAGLAKITLSGAPAGLTIASGKLLAREQPHSHGGGNKGHRSAEITLAYSGPAITVDDPVTVTVMGGSDEGLLKGGDQGGTNPPSLSADFTIRAGSLGGATVSKATLTVPNKQSATYKIKLTEKPSGNVVISLTSGATATATVSPPTLTFTSIDWNTGQDVTVTGRGEGTTSISHAVQSSADMTNYPTTTTLPGVAVTVGAAEPLGATPKVQLLPTFGGRTLPEGLASVSMNLGLTRHLATDETVTLPLSVGGTATRGTDYRLSCRAGGAITCNNLDGASPSITIHGAHMSCNHSASKCRRVSAGLLIDVIEDNTVESDETAILSFGTWRPLTLTLTDTPSSVQVSFTTPDGSFVKEGYLEGLIQPNLRVTPIVGRDISVPLVYRDITATAGEDYEAKATVTFFARGLEVNSVDIPYFGDTLCEGDETFEIRIDSSRLPAGMTVGEHASTVFTIRDDEACTMGFASASHSVTEGGSVSVTVNIDPPLATDTKVDLTWSDPKRQGDTTTAYHYNHTYDSALRVGVGQDYVARPLRLTIPANAASHTFTVRTLDEPAAVLGSSWRDREGVVVEPDETFTITIRDEELPNPHYVNGHRVTTVTIEDNDGGSADTTSPRVASIVRHSPSSSPTAADRLTWRITFDEAVRNVDAGDFTVSGTTATLAVAPVAGTNAYDVTASGGDLAGLDGTVTLGFANNQDIEDTSGNALAQTTPTGSNDNSFVVNNTSPPPQLPAVTVSAGTSPVTEGTNADFTVSRTGATTSALTVLLEVSENTAGGRDFVASGKEGDQSVTIPAGSATATWNVPTVGDSTDEPDGAVTVSLRGSSDYAQGSPSSATVTVNDDDAPAPNACDPDDVQGDVEDYVLETQHGTAHVDRWKRVLAAFGVDNGATPMTATEAQVFSDRGWSRWDPVVTVLTCLENAGTAGTDPEITVTGGGGITEGGNAVFTVHSNPAPAAALTVTLTVDDDAAGDFLATGNEGTQAVTILAGEASAALTLPTVQDTTDEPDGVVTATVAPGSGYRTGTPAAATVAVSDDDDPVVPVVRIAGGGNIVEGGTATFTLTAVPPPAVAITVRVEVTETGSFAGSGQTGTKDVTIGTGGTATLTVGTDNDTSDEANGSIMARVLAGTGYAPHSTSGSASVAVADDDTAPVVSIAGGGAVTEGGDAVFTLTATPPPSSALTVRVNVTERGSFALSGQTGTRNVTVGTSGTGTLTVGTDDDAVDETDGFIRATVVAGTGYTPSTSAHQTEVNVADNDLPAGAPGLSVDDVSVPERHFQRVAFTVRLNDASHTGVWFRWRVRESDPVSARRNVDYWSSTQKNWAYIRPGATQYLVLAAMVIDDAHNEGNETFEIVLSDVGGAAIADAVGVATIMNDDPMPAAFLSRFGRTVAEQALDGIAGRIAADRTPGVSGSFAGHVDLGALAARDGNGTGEDSVHDAATTLAADGHGIGLVPPDGHGPALAFTDDGDGAARARLAGETLSASGHDGFGDGDDRIKVRSVTLEEAMLATGFTATRGTDAAGGSLAFWGRADLSGFDGREGTFSLDGEAATAMLGADYARGRWLAGLMVMQSSGEGGYADSGGGDTRCPQELDAEARRVLCGGAVREGDGDVEASLTAAVPYLAYRASERIRLWGALGRGTGEVTLEPEAGGGPLAADLSWSMAAAGLRGDLRAPSGAFPALAVTADALATRTSSDATDGLAASESDTSRLRVGIEGSWDVALGDGGRLRPRLEIGARHDGGDAETGLGIELGGGVSWTDPGLGISLDLSGRTLVMHDDGDLADRGVSLSVTFDPDPASGRGPTISMKQDLGGAASGGIDALFAHDPLTDRAGGDSGVRRTVEAAWGLPALGGRFTGSPHAGLSTAGDARDWTLGWRLAPEGERPGTPDLTFGTTAVRREGGDGQATHSVGVEAGIRW